MSRIVSHTIRLVPSGFYCYNNYVTATDTSHPATNAYTNVDSTTYATFTSTSRSTSTYVCQLYGFDFDSIPANDVTGFVIKVKGYESGLSTSSSYAPYICTTSAGSSNPSVLNNTRASTNFSTSTQTITIPNGTLTWDTILSYGSNLAIGCSVRRSNKNTQGYLYIYGAEIAVTYNVTEYLLSVTNNSSSVTTSTSSAYISKDDTYTITFTIPNISTTNILLNSNSIVNDLVHTSGNNYTYTFSGLSSDSTLVINDVPAFNISVISTSTVVTSANSTITPVINSTVQTAQGSNFEFSIVSSNANKVNIYDNNIIVTSYCILNNNTLTYTITNVQAAHTIKIEDKPTYQLTATSNVSGTTVSPTSVTLYEYENQEFKIYTNDIQSIVIYDNSADVTANAIYTNYDIIEDRNATLTPEGGNAISDTNCTNSAQTTNYGRGAHPSSNTSKYASLKSGSSTQYYTWYYFDTSSIPSNATDINISCQLRAKVQGASNTYIGYAQLRANETLKGSKITLNGTNTNGAVVAISNTGSWTRVELENINLYISHPYGGSNRYVYFYGADLIITYKTKTGEDEYYSYTVSSVQEGHTIIINENTAQILYIKTSGSWGSGASHVYLKLSGTWVEQNDFTDLFDSDKVYITH